MVAILRTMTMKSVIGFGKYENYTVRKLIDMGLRNTLIRYYYFYSNVNYTEEVFEALLLEPKYRIEKPGKNTMMYSKVIEELGQKKLVYRFKTDPLFKIQRRIITKRMLQSKNHGK